MDEYDASNDTTNDTDRIGDYFNNKAVLKTLRKDLKELTENHEDYEELKKISDKAKLLRKRIADTEDIRILKEKISGLNERNKLLKEIIKSELLASEQEEIKVNDRKLKIIAVLKEMRADAD